MQIGIDISIRGSGLHGSGVATPTAPVLSVVSVVDDAATLQGVIDDTVGDGDSFQVQVQADGGDWSILVEDITDTITSGEDAANAISAGLSNLPDGDLEARMRVREGSGPWSSWSNVVDFEIDVGEAPFLSSPDAAATGTTTASLAVDTNVGSGTLYWVVTTSATPPSAAQVKAGNDHTGSAAVDSGSQAVSGTGTQNVSGGATGLSSGTAYYAYFMHEESSQQSNVETDSFTTVTPVTLGTIVQGTDTSDASTYTFTSVAAGTAADDRIMACAIGVRGLANYSSVTIGGVTADLRMTVTNTSDRVFLVTAAVPTGTTATVVVTLSGSTSRCGIALVPIYGAGSAVPTDTDSSTSDPGAVTLTVPANGVALGYTLSVNGASYTWTGLTEAFDGAVESTVVHSAAGLESEAGGDIAMQADAASTPTDPVTIFAAWGP